MNDNEAIDRAIAMLEMLRPQKKPRERWCAIDRDGDLSLSRESRAEAERDLERCRRDGLFAPYSLAHIVEVIE